MRPLVVQVGHPLDAAALRDLCGSLFALCPVQCIGYEKFRSHNPDVMGARRLRVGDALNLRKAARTRQPYILDDVTRERDWLPAAETRWIRSNLTVPIVIGAEVVGFLSLNSATRPS